MNAKDLLENDWTPIMAAKIAALCPTEIMEENGLAALNWPVLASETVKSDVHCFVVRV